MKMITSTQIFPGASIAVFRSDDKFIVRKLYGAFGTHDVQEFNNPDDALHAASELANQKSAAMHGFYKQLGGASETTD